MGSPYNSRYILISNLDFNLDEIEIFRIIEARIGRNSLIKTMWLRNPEGQREDEVLACFKDFGDANLVHKLLDGYQVGSTKWVVVLSKRTIEYELAQRRKIDSIRYGIIF
jgi:hypothetical protein